MLGSQDGSEADDAPLGEVAAGTPRSGADADADAEPPLVLGSVRGHPYVTSPNAVLAIRIC